MTRRTQHGFTLVELLSIVLIMAILMGITIPVLRSTYARAKVAKAKSDIAKFEAALEAYKSDWGSYPAADAGDVFPYSKFYKTTDPTEPINSPITKKPYVLFKAKDIKNNQVIDSWGNSYIYNATSPSHNTTSFDIYSYGPDKANDTGGDDDINNWSR